MSEKIFEGGSVAALGWFLDKLNAHMEIFMAKWEVFQNASNSDIGMGDDGRISEAAMHDGRGCGCGHICAGHSGRNT